MIVSYKGPNTLSVQIIVIRPYYHFFLVPIYFAVFVSNNLIVRVIIWFKINYNISIIFNYKGPNTFSRSDYCHSALL